MADSIPTPFSDPDVPAALRPIISRMQATIDTYTAGLLAGELTPDEWEGAMSVLIARYHGTALRAGQGGGGLSEAAQAVLQGLVGVQLAFLANFAHVIRTAGPNMAEYAARFRARALSYALAVKTAYAQGDIIRQVGRPLPLPAMPCQGTICGGSCLCRWRVEIVNALAGDYNAYWERHANDSCQTCQVRGELWNPVLIRDGRLVVDYRLKHLAGQHDQMAHGRGGEVDLDIARSEVARTFPDGARRNEALQALSPSKWDEVVVSRGRRGEINGVASFWKAPDIAGKYDGIPDGKYIRIRNMATSEAGHGRELLAEIARYAISHNAGIYLSSLEGSRGFYEKMGMNRGIGATYYMTYSDLMGA